MKKYPIIVTAAVAAALIVPTARASADLAYYTPPKIIKRGTNQTPAPGSGKVIVKVLISASGAFKSATILTSTNHADDAAALEIAKGSTYSPASRGSVKQLAYYDFTLKFAGGGVSSSDSSSASSVARYEALLRSGNYSAAQMGLKSYVAAHPSDSLGALDLGIADTYLKNYADATAAFDKAGTIPAGAHAVAGKAYVEYAVGLLNAKDFPNGLTAAKKAAQIAPGFAADDTLGVAELASGDAQSAVPDLEKAQALAKTDASISAASKVADDEHLVQAYLAVGDTDKAQAAATAATALDPKASTTSQAALAQYYAGKASDASNAGQGDTAGALYEQAAAASPVQAVLLYTNAAFAYLKAQPAEDAKAKAAADKALALNASDPAANYAEGVIAADTGKTNDAKTFLTKADQLATTAGNTALAQAVEKALMQLDPARSKTTYAKPD